MFVTSSRHARGGGDERHPLPVWQRPERGVAFVERAEPFNVYVAKLEVEYSNILFQVVLPIGLRR